MLDKFNELPDWIARGLNDLFPHNDSADTDQSFIKRLELSSKENKHKPYKKFIFCKKKL